MAASDAQIAANRRNASLSTGPNSPEGKDRSRRNALKHGMAATVVVPDEMEGEVAFRVALAQESLAPDDDGLALLLAERVGYLTHRLKRCFQYEQAMTAHRVRNAPADYEDQCMTRVETILSQIANEPPTGSRQLRSTPEGVDLLISWMHELAGEVDHRWGEYHCYKFDEATGTRSFSEPYSRVRTLTQIATKNDPTGLEPGEEATIPPVGPERTAWALAEIAGQIQAELARLHDLRATLDHARFDANRAQASKRALQGVDRDTATAKKYERAAALELERTLKQIDAYRREQRRSSASERAAERNLTNGNFAPETREHDQAPAAASDLGSFPPVGTRRSGPIDASEFTIGKPPTTPFATPKPPRYTP